MYRRERWMRAEREGGHGGMALFVLVLLVCEGR